MNQFSLLVRLDNPNGELIQRMLNSVLSQSNNDWELVLVVSKEAIDDQAVALSLAVGQPNVRVEVRPEGELLAWSCNALLPSLGNWIGFLGQHDQLTLNALDTMAATVAAHSQARVAYSDEEALGIWGQVSLPFAKAAVDPIRLRSQEYLRDLALIRTDWLKAVGGFDRQASDQPRHALYLRLLEEEGSSGFAHVPQRLYRRHRNRLAPRPDIRSSPYVVGYDLQGVRQYLERSGLPAKVKQIHGTLDTDFRFDHHPSVTVLLVLGDDLVEGKARLSGIGLLPTYQPWTVQVLFHGERDEVFNRYRQLCQGRHYPCKRVTGSLPAALNQEASTADTDLVLFLQGMPLNAHWLKRLVELTQGPDVMAAGPTLMTPVNQVDGGPWNSRGSFDHLVVPHSVSMLPAACLLVNTRKFLSLSGFEPTYPALYAQDFTLRLSSQGGRCVRTPRSQVQVSALALPEPGELELFRSAWAGWEDPYALHQLP